MDNTIAIDAMGGDNGPIEAVEGVKLLLEELEDAPSFKLVGKEEILRSLVCDAGLSNDDRVSIYHANEVIGMDEKPIASLKAKKDSSMVQGLNLVKEGICQAMVSCGNTGSLMAGATIKLRPMPGLERPALSSVIPSKDHHFILVDAGANPDPEPHQMAHNAVLGSNHCKVILGVKSPKVGLLTIGTEEGKGTELVQETHKHLKALDGLINYTGLIEGFHVFERDVDVVVCDGFVGNILVKVCESMFHMLKDLFKEELTETLVRKIGAGLLLGAFKNIKNKFDPDKFGAAPLMGINGIVLKAHGSSNRRTIKNATRHAIEMLKLEMNSHVLEDIERANAIMRGEAVVGK